MKNPDPKNILVINPGSTSTRLAVFSGKKKILEEKISHSADEIGRFLSLWDQFDFRLGIVQQFLSNHSISISKMDAVVGRGGLLKPVPRGTFRVNAKMLQDAKRGVQGEHVSNLGCVLAYEIAKELGCKAFVVDPVSVDEFMPVARYSGHPLIERKSLSHALNLRAAAIWASEKKKIPLRKTHFIVAHLGGGISIAAVDGGKIIDVNDASSAGPFSPERTGSLPLQPFIDLCFSGKFTKSEIKKMVMGEGGLKAYLGTADLSCIEARIQSGDEKAAQVFEAMTYQIAKEIGATATIFSGKVHGIVLTGGLASSKRLVKAIRKRVRFLAPVLVLPGELETEAMAYGVLRILQGKEKAKRYA